MKAVLTLIVLSLALSAQAQSLVLSPHRFFSKQLAGPKALSIRVSHLPPLGWDQSEFRPQDIRVRKALTGIRLGVLGTGPLERPEAGLRLRNRADGLFLLNGSLLPSLIGQEVRWVGASSEARLQPYLSASAGYMGGYLVLPRELGRSGLASAPQLSARAGVFVGRHLRIEYGYQAIGRMKGVRLSSTTLRFQIRS
jgi:hypothetical protein